MKKLSRLALAASLAASVFCSLAANAEGVAKPTENSAPSLVPTDKSKQPSPQHVAAIKGYNETIYKNMTSSCFSAFTAKLSSALKSDNEKKAFSTLAPSFIFIEAAKEKVGYYPVLNLGSRAKPRQPSDDEVLNYYKDIATGSANACAYIDRNYKGQSPVQMLSTFKKLQDKLMSVK